jgi:DNA replication ATP-dependent helicase Dna2
MRNFVNIKHFKDDINSIDIFGARVLTIGKDIEITDKNDKPVLVSILTLQSGEDTLKVNLWGKWRAMANYLNPDDNVNVIDGKSRDFTETKTVNVLDGTALGYIILEPSILIDATKMAGIAIKHSHFCFLKYHQKRMRIENVVNYYVMKGNIVGGLFDGFLADTDNFDFEGAFKRCLNKEKIKFIGIDYIPSLKNIKSEVKRDLENLTEWYLNGDFKEYEKYIEPDFISTKYGLQGRMDILFRGKNDESSIIVELKTGRFPEEKGVAWIYHKFQVLAYNFIHDSVFGEKPQNLILYSGSNDISRELSFSNDLKRDFIFLRNKMVFYEKRYIDFDYEMMLSFRREHKDCKNCPGYLKKKCGEIYEIFDSLDDEQKSYYFSFYRVVEHERKASIAKNCLLWNDSAQSNCSMINPKRYIIDGLKFIDFNAEEGVAALKFDDNLSGLRAGDTVVLHTGDPEHERLFKGRVAKFNKDTVFVELRNNYNNTFSRDIKWTLNRFDYMTGATVMLDGLFKFAKSEKRFKDLIMLKTNPEFDNINIIQGGHSGNFTLNSAQNTAVNKSICSRDYFLLQGPPGTGKTKTIAYIINELVKRKQRVILSALTNRAVDNVLLRLMEDHGFSDFLRIGHAASVDERLHRHVLTAKAAGYDVKDIGMLKKEVKKTPLIAATTTSASLSFIFDNLTFDAAIIDEASQIPEPCVFSTITRANKFIMVGDMYQLGPVTRSEYRIEGDEDRAAGIEGLQKTLFQRLWEYNTNRYDIEDDNNPCGILDVQYRMNEEIVKFSNMKFYGGVLKTDESVAGGKIAVSSPNGELLPPAMDPEKPVIFIDVLADNSSHENKEEAQIVTDILKGLVDEGINGADIGIVSPFKAQCALIRRMIEPHDPSRDVIVDTVERFQGSEKDVIITSFVVGDLNGLDFLKENDVLNRKLNVTITRARKKLILIGNKKILLKDPVYKELVTFIDKLYT